MGNNGYYLGGPSDEFLENFEWSEALRREYASKARSLAARYGSNQPTSMLECWPRGVCQDCRREVGRRWRFGKSLLLLCAGDVAHRTRVARDLIDSPLGPPAVRGEYSQVAPIFANWEAEQRWRNEQAKADDRRRKEK